MKDYNHSSRLPILIFMSFLALSLPVVTKLVLKIQDDRSKATEETSDTKLSFKIAFRGVKPEYSCLSSLNNIDLDIVNVTSKNYQSDIGTSIVPISGETNQDGDQVFLVSNLSLDSKFKSVDNFNYLRIKNQNYLVSKMCFNHQSSKMSTTSACDLILTNGTTYDFSNYPLNPGDLNQDGMVNSVDFSVVKDNIDSSSNTACDKTGDLNYDGMVNSFDISFLKKSLLQTNDEAVIDLTTITPTPTLEPTPTETPTPVEIKYAVAGDVHNCTGCLEKIIKRAKSDEMQILILAGDLTVNGTKDELNAIKKVLDNSGMKYVVTPGNHDGYKGLFYNVFELGYQSFKINGNKFILIDDSSYKSLNYNSKTANQKNWIVSELNECKTITCIVVMHRPINNPSSDHIMGEDNATSASEAKWLLKLLIDNKVKEIESGHIHHFETYTLGGMKTNLVGAGKDNRFSEFTIDASENITRKQIQL